MRGRFPPGLARAIGAECPRDADDIVVVVAPAIHAPRLGGRVERYARSRQADATGPQAARVLFEVHEPYDGAAWLALEHEQASFVNEECGVRVEVGERGARGARVNRGLLVVVFRGKRHESAGG